MSTKTDSSFRLRNLTSGDYKLLFRNFNAQELDCGSQWYGNTIKSSDASVIHITAGQITPIQATVPDAVEVSGLVKPESMSWIATGRVYAANDPDGLLLGYVLINDPWGEHWFFDAAPGDYLVRFDPEETAATDRWLDMWYGNSPTKDGAVVIHVGSTDINGLDATFTRAPLMTPLDKPAVSGKTHPEKTLTVSGPSWQETPDRIAYRWFYANGHRLTRSTSSRIHVRRSDIGHRMYATVTAYKRHFGHAAAKSNVSARVTRN